MLLPVALGGCSGEPPDVANSSGSGGASRSGESAAFSSTSNAVTSGTTTTSRPPIQPGTIPGTGLFQVGTEIQPGTYVAENPPTATCYVARLGRRDAPDPLIVNNVAKGRMTITVEKTDAYVETRDCVTWTKR